MAKVKIEELIVLRCPEFGGDIVIIPEIDVLKRNTCSNYSFCGEVRHNCSKPYKASHDVRRCLYDKLLRQLED